MNFKNYESGDFYDELILPDGTPRPAAGFLVDKINTLNRNELKKIQSFAELELLNMGITFNVVDDKEGKERIFPFDLIPRTITASEWDRVDRGLKQRIRALNEFLIDVYGDQKILKDKIIPSETVYSADGYHKIHQITKPHKNIWCYINGSDLIRGKDGNFMVLEDNLRVPSGVSYVIENRIIMKRVFPDLFRKSYVEPIDDYSMKLLDVLRYVSPNQDGESTIALLTPGVYNSAYFEHSFLAQEMGIELVEGRDLFCHGGYVHMRTTQGFKKVDVLYRRIDDAYLDPHYFKNDSVLGVPGLMDVYRNGRISLVNAPGTGVADDKVIYAYVPKMIKYYLNEDPILPNVETYICGDSQERDYVLANLEKLVVKTANGAGGYGMLMGPSSTVKERKAFAEKIKQTPRNYIAQPPISLSRVPTIIGNKPEGRHVDLRPFVLYGKDIFVMPGGLTRVALKKNSLIVNSSQGGGSKDTWVLGNGPC